MKVDVTARSHVNTIYPALSNYPYLYEASREFRTGAWRLLSFSLWQNQNKSRLHRITLSYNYFKKTRENTYKNPADYLPDRYN